MKRKTVKRIKKYILLVAIMLIVVSIAANSSVFAYPVKLFASNFASPAVSMILPYFNTDKSSSAATDLIEETEKTENNNVIKDKKPNTTPTNKKEQTTKEKTVLTNSEEKGGRVLTQTIDKSGATASYGDIYVRNKTAVSINVKNEASKKPDLKIKLKSKEPQVLIVHTHATESFFPKLVDYYPKSWGERDNNPKNNMVSVGKVIASTLNKAGINTVQSEFLHDKESYTGAYDRSRETIKRYLKKYPSIKVVLDVHRDAINQEDGSKIRPIVNIKNKTAGQIMLISGCESGPIVGYPNWRKNLHFSLGLQKMLEQTYPSFARPLFFAEKKYNQDLCPNSVLVEVGSQANLLSEAKNSASLFSNVLIKYLKSFS